MARKTQLLQLVAQLRAETGRTQKVAVGIDEVDNLKEILRRNQEILYDGHDWAHLRVERSIQLNAGQRYYDLPSDLNFDRIETVKLNYNGQYVDVERIILLTDYDTFDSNADTPQRSNPMLKWDIRDTGSDEQLEAWPIPSDNSQKLYFTGFKSLSSLIEESDRADLDDRLIVLYSAAEILARQGSKDAQAKLELAKSRLVDLKRNYAKGSPTVRMGIRNRDDFKYNRTTVVVSS